MAEAAEPAASAVPQNPQPAAVTPPPGAAQPPAATAPRAPRPFLEQQPTTTPAPAQPVPVTGGQPRGVVLNFRDASLESVLNYLSEAAGFVVVLDTRVEGTVNVVSHQPLNPDEAVDLLNTILFEKGYTAVRNGRILKIVGLNDAARYNVPVRSGSDPATIPPKDEVVTQIIPVRYAEAMKLIENLEPLLPETAKITANESSNAIVLTDTQVNIRRMAEIIRALDTSISGISTVKVFPLRYSDATQLAEVVNDLFKNETSNSNNRRSGMPAFMMGGRGGDRGRNDNNGDSEARQAASRVVALADERTNSLVVSAPDELLPTIAQLVAEIDTNVADLTEMRIFRLEHSDATEMAQLLMQLFSEDATSTSSRNSRFGGRMPPFMMGGRGNNSSNSQSSERKLEQSKVVAVGDPRTNTLLVTAGRDMMTNIAEMVGRLDSDNRKRQKVFVYPLEHADVDNVATILEGMFPTSSSSGTGTRTGTSRTGTRTGTGTALSNRQSSGASIDPSLGGRNAGGGGGGGGF
jgi:general secretion pathway protein D